MKRVVMWSAALLGVAGALAGGAVLSRAQEVGPAPGPDALARRVGVVHVRAPEGPPRVDTGRLDAEGRPLTASCGTCHATRAPNTATRRAEDLREFHQGLTYAHGEASCLSCHHAGDYDRLRLADGTAVPFEEVMRVCAQCHGPQFRDYRHGSHGGMNGYWDLSRGDRWRNNCVDCHDPHAPGWRPVQPVFPPRDRFSSPREDGHD